MASVRLSPAGSDQLPAGAHDLWRGVAVDLERALGAGGQARTGGVAIVAANGAKDQIHVGHILCRHPPRHFLFTSGGDGTSVSLIRGFIECQPHGVQGDLHVQILIGVVADIGRQLGVVANDKEAWGHGANEQRLGGHDLRRALAHLLSQQWRRPRASPRSSDCRAARPRPSRYPSGR